MDCIIEGKARPSNSKSNRNGQPAVDTKKTVRAALTHSNYWYRLVFRHVSQCSHCDPEEIARAYLESRKAEKLRGMLTKQLCILILKYKNLAAVRKTPFDPDLAVHAIVNCQDYDMLVKHTYQLDLDQIYTSLKRKVHLLMFSFENGFFYKVRDQTTAQKIVLDAILGRVDETQVPKHRAEVVARALPYLSFDEKLDEVRLAEIFKIIEVHLA